jgi:hypothetical protein
MSSTTVLLVTAAVTSLATPPAQHRPAVDLAICLDTSGSMSGLIDSARQSLWAIVNDLASARPAPALRVALLTYGNTGHLAENGWVNVDSPFTSDLDAISRKLFALGTNGGEEYVGRVLQSAGRLDWTPEEGALRLVVVAGNESADQDREVPFGDMCRALIERGIMINSIYCGNPADGDAPGWRDVALMADGRFAVIDQDHGTVVIETPFDAELSALSASINTTYIPFGAGGSAGLENQAQQDGNAASLNSAASAQRAETKANAIYVCAWDLVDACLGGAVRLEEVPAGELPEAMQGMSLEERRGHVAAMAAKRAGIQARILELTQQRSGFVADEMKERALDDSKAFDAALRRAIRAQAESRGFEFRAP